MTTRRSLQIKTVRVEALRPRATNPRTHSNKQIRQIATSIERFGWVNPIIIDGERGVIAGHGRLEAARLIGLEKVPTICIDDMSEDQVRAYVIADNKLAENAGWDREMLAIELSGLMELETGFEITDTGFEMGEIDMIIGDFEAGDEKPDAADAIPDRDPATPVVTRPGDLWLCGRHRVMCADATEAVSYETLMASRQARMVFTDPPYNVPIGGHVSGLGRHVHDEFAMACGEMSEEAFTAFLSEVLSHAAGVSMDGSIHFVCMDWAHLHELLNAGRTIYDDLKNICVWNKSNGGMGSLYRSKHEMIAVFKKGKAPHVNNVALGRFGRNRTNVWDYAGMNAFGAERDKSLAMHPTVKPVALVEDAILDCSNRGDIVLDGFLGSGTTLIAAERAGRVCFGLELAPAYVDIALERWRQQTGEEPVHAGTGLTFTVLKDQRAAHYDGAEASSPKTTPEDGVSPIQQKEEDQ